MSMAMGEILGTEVPGEPGKTPSLRKRGKNILLSVMKFKTAACRCTMMVQSTRFQIINFLKEKNNQV